MGAAIDTDRAVATLDSLVADPPGGRWSPLVVATGRSSAGGCTGC